MPANIDYAAALRLPREDVAKTLASFMENFYAISDDPVAHEKYAEQFTPDATLIMGGNSARGYDEILAFRKALWAAVSSRTHTVGKMFFGGGDDAMLFGKVAYVLKKNGRQLQLDWSARAEFSFNGNGQPKFKYYQVYLDTKTQVEAAQAD